MNKKNDKQHRVIDNSLYIVIKKMPDRSYLQRN